MDGLPEFQPRPYDIVYDSMMTAFSRSNDADDTFLVDLLTYDDHHFRAVFQVDYFLHDDREQPSKSQWSTLKKRIKRMYPFVFVFKDTGYLPCSDNETDSSCCFLDFGFLDDD